MIAEQAGSGNPHPNVRFWLLADIKLLRDLGLLYPRKRTFLEGAKLRLLLTQSGPQLAFRKTSLLILDNFDGALLGGFFDLVLEA